MGKTVVGGKPGGRSGSWTVIVAADERIEGEKAYIQAIIPAGSFIIPDGISEIHIHDSAYYSNTLQNDPGANLTPVSTAQLDDVLIHLSLDANGEWKCITIAWSESRERHYASGADLNSPTSQVRLVDGILSWNRFSVSSGSLYYMAGRHSAVVQYR